jgi:hypothetical protein
LDFINDPFITELLTGITKYMLLSEKSDFRNHAQQKAASLTSQIKKLHLQSKLVEPNGAPKQYRIYKSLSLEERLRCLIKDEDVAKIEAEQASLDKDLFSITLSRIIRVINCNFFKDFFLLELLSLTQVHAGQLPPLGFNSCGDSLPDVKQQGRQANIFAFMAINKPKL